MTIGQIIIGIVAIVVVGAVALAAGGFLNAVRDQELDDIEDRIQGRIHDLRADMAHRSEMIQKLIKNKKRHSHLVEIQNADMIELLKLEGTVLFADAIVKRNQELNAIEARRGL